jgi:hypothetical protein
MSLNHIQLLFFFFDGATWFTGWYNIIKNKTPAELLVIFLPQSYLCLCTQIHIFRAKNIITIQYGVPPITQSGREKTGEQIMILNQLVIFAC